MWQVAGLDRVTVQNVERGKPMTLTRIARALDVPLADLVRE
ncbi:hypothetical protein ACWEQU_32765 [Streptomyces nodosus]